MNGLIRLTAVASTVVCAVWVAAISPAGATDFEYGTRTPMSPMQSVTRAATEHSGCPERGLTINKLRALILAITWNEVTGHDTEYAPSPMTLSRGDNNAHFYPDQAPNGPRRRAFWHPGIGMWQLDDQGQGTNAARGKFNGGYSAHLVAQVLASRYCQGEPIFRGWFGCNGGACRRTYESLYISQGDRLRQIDGNSSVDNTGGTSIRRCRFGGEVVDCSYVNYNRATGHKDSWVYAVDGSPPLAKPFYVITQRRGTRIYEWRVWIRADTSFSSIQAVRRPFGRDSRGDRGLYWTRTVSLCDMTAQRGDC